MNQYDNRYYPPYPYAPQPQHDLLRYKAPLRKWANYIGIGVLMVHGIMFGIMFLLSYLFMLPPFFGVGEEMWELIEQSASLVCHALGFWLSTLFILSRIKVPVKVAFPMRAPRVSIVVPAVFICLGASFVGGYFSAFLSYFFEYNFGLIPTSPDFSLPVGTAANIVYCVSLIVSAPVFEELLFRGVIMQSLRRFGDGFAVMVSSILFALIHGNLIQGPGAFLFGLVTGYFVLRTGSIFTGIILHAVNNALSVGFSYLMEFLTESQVQILDISVTAGYVVLGIAAVVFLLIRHGGVFRVAPSNYPLPASKKYPAFFLAAAQICFLIATVILTATFFE